MSTLARPATALPGALRSHHRGDERGVGLHLAVNGEVDAARAQQLHGPADLGDSRMLRAALRGEGEESGAGLFVEERPAALGRRFGDVRELLRRGVRDDGAVAVDQAASVGQCHQEAGRDHLEAGTGADHPQGGPQRVGGGRPCAHDGTVGAHRGDPEGGVVQRIAGELLGFFGGDPAGAQALGQARGKMRPVGLAQGIEDGDGQRHAGFRRRRLDFLPRADQCRPAEACGDGALGGRDHPRILAFGQDDRAKPPRGRAAAAGREDYPED